MGGGGLVMPAVSNKQDQKPRTNMRLPIVQMGRKRRSEIWMKEKRIKEGRKDRVWKGEEKRR
jgi:hypothetical protein